MKTVGKHELIAIDQIELDTRNPRIAKFLEIYSGEPTAEQIFIALGAGGDEKDTEGGPNFDKLRQSIITNEGIIQPIIVNRLSEGRNVCIDGNTRLALYRSFQDEKIKGDWKNIPCIVYNDLDEEDIDAIRLQAHLVGPRQWDPYSKAKYLSYLRN
jgi:ParB/Sulfiredoxin domain